jgi:hypothetical protein
VITAYIKSCGIDEDELSDDLVVKYETKVSGAIVSDAYRAGLLFNPVLRYVIPKPIPTESKVIRIGPKPGSKNQFALSTKVKARKVPVNTRAKTFQKVPRFIAKSDPQNSPPTRPNATFQVVVTEGSARKVLKRIAKYCFKRTATQKIGSENNRNATNVIE